MLCCVMLGKLGDGHRTDVMTSLPTIAISRAMLVPTIKGLILMCCV
jgi:hypothetical protein